MGLISVEERERKINKYIKDNPLSYIGYYSKVIVYIDKIVYDSTINKKFTIRMDKYTPSEINNLMKQSIKLYSNNNLAIKYYLLSLILMKDKNIADGINQYEKNILNKIRINKFYELLIDSIFNKIDFNELKIRDIDIDNLDSVDYLIIYILQFIYPECIDKSLNVLKKYINSNKTVNKLEIIYAYMHTFNQDNIDIELIKNNLEYALRIDNKYIRKIIVENSLIKTINDKTYKSIIEILKRKNEFENQIDEYNKLLQLYKDYLTNKIKDNYDIKMLVQITKLNEEKLGYLLYTLVNDKIKNIVNDKETKQYIDNLIKRNENIYIEQLIQEVYFLQHEIEKIKKIKDEGSNYSYLKDKYKNIHKIELDKQVVDSKNIYNIAIEFENYRRIEVFKYNTNVENYYYLPEAPLRIKVMDSGNVIETKFKSKKIDNNPNNYSEVYFTFKKIENQGEIKGCQSDVFDLYRYFRYIGTLDHIYTKQISHYSINSLIDNNSIFHSEDYFNILNKVKYIIENIDKNKQKYFKECISRIMVEICRDLNDKDDIHNIIENEHDFEKKANIIKFSIRKDIDLYTSTINNCIKSCIDNNYYDLELFKEIENYIVDKKILHNTMYEYLIRIYEEKEWFTENTPNVIDVIRVYKDDNNKALELIIRYYINSNKFNDFKFKNIINNLNENGKYNLLSKELLIKLVETVVKIRNLYSKDKEYNYSSNFLEIIQSVYQETKAISLLEEIIYFKVENKYQEISIEDLKILENYYIENKIFNKKSKLICNYILNSNNYDSSEHLNKYFIESIKYEIVTVENNISTISINNTNYHINNKDNSRINSYSFDLGYTSNYTVKLNEGIENTYRRDYIVDNLELLLKYFDKIDDTLDEFIICELLSKNIYNEDILITNIEKYQINLNKTYSLLIKNSLLDYKFNLDKIIGYIKSYINLDKNNNINMRDVLKLVKELDFSIEYKIIIVSYIISYNGDKIVEDNQMIMNIQQLIEQGINLNKLENLNYLFNIIYDHIPIDAKYQELFILYMRNIDSINRINRKTIEKIYELCWIQKDKKSYTETFLKDMIDIIGKKNKDYEFVKLILCLYKIDESIFRKLNLEEDIFNCINREIYRYDKNQIHIYICLASNIKYIEMILKTMNSNYILDEEFIESIIDVIIEKLQISGNVKQNIDVLDILKSNKKANEMLMNLKSEDMIIDIKNEVVIHDEEYNEKELIEDTCIVEYKEELELHIDNLHIKNILDKYLSNISLVEVLEHSVKFKEYLKLNEVEKLNSLEVLKGVLKLIEMIKEVSKHDYFVNLDINKIVIINNTIIPVDIQENKLATEKEYIEDLKKLIKYILKKSISYYLDKASISIIMTEQHNTTNFASLKLLVYNLIKEIESDDYSSLYSLKNISEFDMLSKDMKLKIVRWIVSEDKISKEAYNIVLEFDELKSIERISYLLKYINFNVENIEATYICVYNEIMDMDYIDGSLYDDIRIFIIEAEKNGYINKRRIKNMITKIDVFDEISKEALLRKLEL